MDADHRHFDDIGGGALDGGIDGVAFSHAAYHGIPGVDIAQVAPPSENGLHVLFFACFLHGGFHILLNPRIQLEIAVYQLLSLLAADMEPLCQSPGGNAVYDAEIGSLCAAPHFQRHLFQGHVIYLRCGGGMHVDAVVKGIHQFLVAAQVRHQPQLHLRIVCGEKHEIIFAGHESLPDFSALFRADGDILQVRVQAAEPSCGGFRLVEPGMDFTCPAVDESGQSFRIGAQQFLQSAIIQYLRHDGMVLFQFGEHLLRGAVLPRFGLLVGAVDFQFVEEHFPQLFR